jgi:hypothetical protein
MEGWDLYLSETEGRATSACHEIFSLHARLSNYAMSALATILSLVASLARPFGHRSAALTIAPRDQTRPIVFTHMPKTSGTAIVHGLLGALDPSRPIGGFDMSQFSKESNFVGIKAELQSSIYHDTADIPRDADFVFGHLAASTTFSIYPQAQHITFLREPLSRVLSHYLYWRSLDETALSPWGELGTRVHAAHAPLVEFLSNNNLACQIDNIYVRMLLWPHVLIPDSGWIDPTDDDQLVDAALQRLHAYSYVDIIENPAMQSSLHKWLGGNFDYSRMNVTAKIPPKLRRGLDSELTPGTTTLLVERSRLDLRLWQAVAASRSASIAPAVLQLMALLPAIARYGQLMVGSDLNL